MEDDGEKEEAEKRETGRGSRGGGRIEEREYPERGSSRGSGAARTCRDAASSSGIVLEEKPRRCVPRVVVVAVDGRSGGTSGAPVEKAEEEEKEDVVSCSSSTVSIPVAEEERTFYLSLSLSLSLLPPLSLSRSLSVRREKIPA